MEPARFEELHFGNRTEALAFLKKLWSGKGAPCPICGKDLVLLHKKAKKSDCDWQCVPCGRVFRTIHLLDALNAQK